MGEREDLHELLGTKFTRHRPKDTGADRLLLVVQQNSSIAIEANDGAIGTTNTVTSANHNSGHHLAFLDLATRNRFLDGYFDNVADARSEEHPSELQSLMRISYAVFCLKKKKTYITHIIICQNNNI